MKAKKIFEKFSEKTDPIVDMGIGGFKLIDEFNKRRKKLELDTQKLVKKSNISWKRYLRELLIGKTITAEMSRLPTFDSKTMQLKEKGSNWENFTITVIDLHVESIQYSYNNSIILAGDDGRVYKLLFDSKIYISE